MKRLLPISLLLLVVILTCSADRRRMLLTRNAVATSAYLLNETFESGTAPSGWTTGAGISYAQTGISGMDGTYCLAVTSAGGALTVTSASVGDQTELHFYCKFRIGATMTGELQELQDSSGTRRLLLYDTGSEAMQLYQDSGSLIGFGDVWLTGTTYHFWFDWVAGGTCTVAASTSGTKPTADDPPSGNFYATRTASGAITSDRIALQSNSGVTVYYDTVKLKLTPIGDNGI